MEVSIVIITDVCQQLAARPEIIVNTPLFPLLVMQCLVLYPTALNIAIATEHEYGYKI